MSSVETQAREPAPLAQAVTLDVAERFELHPNLMGEAGWCRTDYRTWLAMRQWLRTNADVLAEL